MGRVTIRNVVLAAALAVVSACATKAPPPPPPVVVTIPPRPYPPMNAATNLTVPPLAPDGTRLTVNSGLGTDQAIWNLRSAYNVAALNCRDAQYAPILEGYTAFLKDHSKTLNAVNKSLDKQFRADHGAKFIPLREAYNTQVYNYFALPPVTPAFCEASLQLTEELKTVAPGQLEGFAFTGLAKLDSVFREFFNSYDQYRADLAAWDARYGAGVVTPVAIAPDQSLVQ